MEQFQIKPLTEPRKVEWEHDTLPIPEFRLIIVAPSAAGKSTALSNIISSKKFPYRDYFGENIFIVSPTLKLGSMDGVDNIKQSNIFDTFNVDVLQEIIEEQTSLIERFPKKVVPYLLVFDDVVADLDKNQKAFLRRCFFGLRHTRGSIIILSQFYRALPKSVRSNATDTMFFEIANTKERQDIAEENSFPTQQFLDVLDYATSIQPFSFLLVRHRKPKHQRLQLRFTNNILS